MGVGFNKLKLNNMKSKYDKNYVSDFDRWCDASIQNTTMDLNAMIKWAKSEIRQYERFIRKCEKEILSDKKLKKPLKK